MVASLDSKASSGPALSMFMIRKPFSTSHQSGSHSFAQDQHLYESTDDMILANTLVFGHGIFSTRGNHHNKQRKLLFPLFSPTQMRVLTPVFHDVANDLCDAIARQITQGKSQINVLEWLSRTALEFVARGVLGTSFDVHNEIEHPYSVSIKSFPRIMTFPGFIFPRFFILPYVKDLGSPRFRRWVVDMLPWKSLHILRDMVDVMHNTSIAIFGLKKDSSANKDQLSSEPGKGKDLMSVLCEISRHNARTVSIVSSAFFAVKANLAAAEEDQLSDSELLAQISAQADTIIPLSKPITSIDGKPMTEIQLPRKTFVCISLNACNRDPAIWGADAREWRPERWLSPLPETVANAKIPGVYSSLMTFYGGHRSCIGFKFTELEMKVVLSSLLQQFRFALGDKKIIWKMNGINQPMAEDSEADLDKYGLPRLQLPLRVTLLSDSDS
ncbi:hypothetical protein H1R20_g14181, partial [Candolleomyces eurysporus]